MRPHSYKPEAGRRDLEKGEKLKEGPEEAGRGIGGGGLENRRGGHDGEERRAMTQLDELPHVFVEIAKAFRKNFSEKKFCSASCFAVTRSAPPLRLPTVYAPIFSFR